MISTKKKYHTLELIRKRQFYYCLLFITFFYILPLTGEQAEEAVNSCTMDESRIPYFECYLPRNGINAYTLYSFGESPAICQDYGSIGFYYASYLPPCTLGFVLDGAYHYFNNNNYGYTGGIGIRTTFSNPCNIGGAHIFYDYLETEIKNYNQIAIALEFFTRCLEFRVNGYFPLNNKIQCCQSAVFTDYDNTGNAVPYEVTIITEQQPLRGFDFESGLNYCFFGVSAYLGLGTYYFDNYNFSSFWGVKGSTRISYGKFLSLEGQVTWDKKNNVLGRGTIELQIPFNMIAPFCCPCKSERRVYRDNIIHTKKRCKYLTNY